MTNLNLNDRKEFKISDVFETFSNTTKKQVPTGSMVAKKDLIEGEYPRISVSWVNNGIIGYYASKDPNFRLYENFISVSFLSTVFYHPYKASLDMKVHCLKPLFIDLNVYTWKFLVSVIRNAISHSSYSDQISSTVLPELTIKLPASASWEPDREFMEKYMKKIEDKVQKSVALLIQISQKENKVVMWEWVSEWGQRLKWKFFHLYDLFEINSWTKLDKSKMKTDNPQINFVWRSNGNNGVTEIVNKIDWLEPYEAWNLTLALWGAYLWSCFIQKEPFYTSQNVAVLKPKNQMNFYTKLFISTAIFKESQNNYCAFIKELNAHIKRDFSFLLPVDDNNQPHYVFMDQYMATLMNKKSQVVSLFCN